MANTESKPARKSWKPKIIVILCIVTISALVLLFFVLPLLLRYERLDVYSYYWVVNTHGEIGQLFFVALNNGTQDLTLTEIWIDNVHVDGERWGGYSGATIQPTHTEWFYVSLKNSTFENGRDYNLTVGTASKSYYSFILNVNGNNTKTEKVEITYVDFFHWPLVTGDSVIQIWVQSLSGTDVIIKKVRIDGEPYNVWRRLWLSSGRSEEGTLVYYPWKKGETYTITIETEAGSIANSTATAD